MGARCRRKRYDNNKIQNKNINILQSALSSSEPINGGGGGGGANVVSDPTVRHTTLQYVRFE